MYYLHYISIFIELISAEIYWKKGIPIVIKVYIGGFSFNIATKPNSAMANCIQ